MTDAKRFAQMDAVYFVTRTHQFGMTLMSHLLDYFTFM